MEAKNISSIISKYGDFLDNFLAIQERYLPLWLSTIIQTIIIMTIGFFLSAFIHPFLLPIFTVFPFYFSYICLIKNQEYTQALKLSFIWTITIAITGIVLTIAFPELATIGILNGTTYQSEMFKWIATGVGAEGNPAQFIPIHILHFTIYCITCLISMSLIGIIFGAYMMNYMDYYVGILFLNVTVPNILSYLTVCAFCWPIWSISRVVGYLFVGTALSIPLTAVLFKQKIPVDVIKKYILIGLVFIIVDIVLKAALAPFYQQILNSVIAT